MPKNLRSNIELVAQVAIAIAVLVVAGVVVKRYLSAGPENRLEDQEQMMLGTRINVPNIDWAENRKTVVFFLNKDCVYCKMSAPLYRDLIAEASKRNSKHLAILPNSIEEGRKYLQELDLPIADVHTAPLSSYRVPVTPTVLFVDSHGLIKGVWMGAAPAKEKAMREQLLALLDA
jgi:peroxiredoxin